MKMPRLARAAWSAPALRPLRSAFTFVEVMVVVVIIGILAAMVIPRFGTVTDDAKASALQAGLGGVRSSIAAYRTKMLLAGSAAYPTLTQLNTTGTVLQSQMPTNPFSNLATVQAVTSAQANARTVLNATTIGWNYYVDNSLTPPVAVFYANSTTVTTVLDSAGNPKTANAL